MRRLWFFAAALRPMVVAVAFLACGTERCPAQEPGKAVVYGEVVEVIGDKVRVALKDKRDPQVGGAAKILHEIAGTDIKAEVATGKLANIDAGFAWVDITKKTAEIRKGYLAEFTAAGTSAPVGGTLADVLDYLPDDCFRVVSTDVSAIMKSKPYQIYEEFTDKCAEN